MSETVKGLKEKLAVAKQEMQDMFVKIGRAHV